MNRPMCHHCDYIIYGRKEYIFRKLTVKKTNVLTKEFTPENILSDMCPSDHAPIDAQFTFEERIPFDTFKANFNSKEDDAEKREYWNTNYMLVYPCIGLKQLGDKTLDGKFYYEL